MYINITASETGGNKGSCSALVNYLEKENRMAEKAEEKENWFNGTGQDIKRHTVRMDIDGNIAKLGRNDSKFFLVNISPSQKEIRHLISLYGKEGAKEKLKAFAVSVMDRYAQNFNRPGIGSNRDLLWFGKLENYRYYGHKDKEVKDGQKQKGERKEGEQMHVQVIVSRKDITDRIKLSPQNTSRGKNTIHSRKMGQFDRTAFKQSGETLFDEMFGFERDLKESMEYANTMKNGTLEQRSRLLSRTIEQQIQKEQNIENQPDHSLQAAGIEAFEQVADIAGELTKAAVDILGGLLDPGNIASEGESSVTDEERKRRRKKKGRGR